MPEYKVVSAQLSDEIGLMVEQIVDGRPDVVDINDLARNGWRVQEIMKTRPDNPYYVLLLLVHEDREDRYEHFSAPLSVSSHATNAMYAKQGNAWLHINDLSQEGWELLKVLDPLSDDELPVGIFKRRIS